MKTCDLTIAIVSWNTESLLRNCLRSICSLQQSYEVIVVDNASNDGSACMVGEEFPQVRLIRNQENRGFAKANNQALREARGRYLLLLNPDTEIIGDALETMIAFMDSHPDAGALGCQLLNPDGTVQISCGHFPALNNMITESLGLSKLFPKSPMFARFKMTYWGHDSECEVDQPSGACLMIRREVWNVIGQLDEQFFMYFEEVDLCYRLKQKGWRIFFTPKAQVIHYGGQSSKQYFDVRIIERYRSMLRYFRKHSSPRHEFLLRGLILVEMVWRSLAVILRVLFSKSAQSNLLLLKYYVKVVSLCF